MADREPTAAGQLGPRLVVAGTRSGAGKTTVATGIMAALSRRGLAVASAKVGPDFIDPGYHRLATGRAGCNLDSWMCESASIAPMAAQASAGADVLVVEGVMGLFDGASLTAEEPRNHIKRGSTADVASLLDAPVLLVVDASSMSESVAAVVHGFSSLSPLVRVAGVVLNQVASDAHEAALRDALARSAVRVVGALRRDDSVAWRDRHLGLVPVIEDVAGVTRSLDRLSSEVALRCELGAIVGIARSARTKAPGSVEPARRVGRARIAVASGPAFSFVYPQNLRRLEEAGAELVPFDPTGAGALPAGVAGLYAGGGFPEVYAESLSSNEPLLADVGRQVRGGLVTWAECGGLLWLCASLGKRPMCGAVRAAATMTAGITLGYRVARALRQNPVIAPGRAVRGHEFHYSRLDDPGQALEMCGREGATRAGFASPSLLASYLHLHMGADPAPAERFVAAASRHEPAGGLRR